MDKEICELKLVDEIILYYDARSKKHQNLGGFWSALRFRSTIFYTEILLTINAVLI